MVCAQTIPTKKGVPVVFCRTLLSLIVFTAALSPTTAAAAQGDAHIDAVTRARYDLKLGFTVGGKIVSIPVKPGDLVEQGQLLAELENEEGKSLVELYQLRASSNLATRSAEAQLELAHVEEKAIRTAYQNDAAKPIEVERARLNTRLAELELSMAKQRGAEMNHQLHQAEARRDQYLLYAPTAGVVDAVPVAEGELVEALKPILQLVVVDPLWVEAAVTTGDTLQLHPGDPAWVLSKLPGARQPIKGVIIHTAQVADAASDTRLIRIEVPNAEGLPAGGQVRVFFKNPSALTDGGAIDTSGDAAPPNTAIVRAAKGNHR